MSESLRITEKQISMIRGKQFELGLPISSEKSLSPMTRANASAWIACLAVGVDPKKVNPKKALGVNSGNAFQRAEQVRRILSQKTAEVSEEDSAERFSRVKESTDCPRCGASAGQSCWGRPRHGEPYARKSMHAERWKAYEGSYAR